MADGHIQEHSSLGDEIAKHNSCTRPIFVIGIDHIVVRDNQKYPNIVIWTKIDQEDTYRPYRKFEYDVVKGRLMAK